MNSPSPLPPLLPPLHSLSLFSFSFPFYCSTLHEPQSMFSQQCNIARLNLGLPFLVSESVSRQKCKAIVEIISCVPFSLEITVQLSLLSNVISQQLFHVFCLLVCTRRANPGPVILLWLEVNVLLYFFTLYLASPLSYPDINSIPCRIGLIPHRLVYL